MYGLDVRITAQKRGTYKSAPPLDEEFDDPVPKSLKKPTKSGKTLNDDDFSESNFEDEEEAPLKRKNAFLPGQVDKLQNKSPKLERTNSLTSSDIIRLQEKINKMNQAEQDARDSASKSKKKPTKSKKVAEEDGF